MSTITILSSGCAPMIGAYFNLFTTFTGTETQMQDHFKAEKDLIAIPSCAIFGKPDTFEYGIFKRRNAPVAMYQVTIGDNVLSFLTLGDVLYALNNTAIPNGTQVSITRSETQFGRQNEYQYITNGLNKKGVTQSLLTPDDFILQLFYEVFFNYIKPAGRVLLPHEMSRGHWDAIIAVRGADEVYPIITSTQRHRRDQLFDDKADKKPRFYFLRDYYTHLLRSHCAIGGPEAVKVYSLYMDGLSHSDFIERALNDDLQISDAVLVDYQDPESLSKGFHFLMKFPQMRGKFSLHTTKILLNMIKEESLLMEESTVNKLVEMLSGIGIQNPTYPQLDNYLYGRGLLNPYPKVDTPAFDRSTLTDPLAKTIHDQVTESIKEARISAISKSAELGEISQREFDRAVYKTLDFAKSAKPTWALNIVEAIKSKNVSFLLDLLDTADAENTVTKKAIADATGIVLLGLNPLDRRANVFKLCGMDENDRSQAESNIKVARDQADFERMKERILQTMKPCQIETKEYGALSVLDFIHTVINEGYNTLKSIKKGAASQYLLCNSQTGKSWPVKNKDGSLPYVRDVLQIPLMS